MEQYKRNQVDLALWQLFTPVGTHPDLHPIFRTRIKRLLELDRQPPTLAPKTKTDGLTADWPETPAFSETRTQWGKGTVATFSLFDAFCLALALDLLDMGFKQSEVVFMIGHIRPKLKKMYKIIQRKLPEPFNVRRAIPEKDRTYMLLRKVEVKEPYPMIADKGHSNEPVITAPVFCVGTDELKTQLLDTTDHYRKTLVMELTKPTALLKGYLEKAKAIRRGKT